MTRRTRERPLSARAENILNTFETAPGQLTVYEVMDFYPPSAWITLALLLQRRYLKVDELGLVHPRRVKPPHGNRSR